MHFLRFLKMQEFRMTTYQWDIYEGEPRSAIVCQLFNTQCLQSGKRCTVNVLDLNRQWLARLLLDGPQ